MKLSEINRTYESIIHSNFSEDKKAIKLARLMTDMEGYFSIPMLQDEKWESENRKVTALYRKISRSRSFDS